MHLDRLPTRAAVTVQTSDTVKASGATVLDSRVQLLCAPSRVCSMPETFSRFADVLFALMRMWITSVTVHSIRCYTGKMMEQSDMHCCCAFGSTLCSMAVIVSFHSFVYLCWVGSQLNRHSTSSITSYQILVTI